MDYVCIPLEILNLEGHLNHITGSRVTAILLSGWTCLLVKLHREGSAPATCAAGLFLNEYEGHEGDGSLWEGTLYKLEFVLLA